MKRSRDGSLTGGTGDVNPQWFTTATQAIGSTYADTGTTIPRERLPYGSRSQVMEILKVQLIFSSTTTFTQTAATAESARIYLTTSSFGATEPTTSQQAGKVIAIKRIDLLSVAAAPAASFQMIGLYDMIDLTDSAGHGLLVATDQVFTGMIQTSAAIPFAAGGVAWRIMYRWKNVGLQEYIGIVQSQQ